MNNDLGGVGGLSRLFQTAWNLWASAQASRGGDHIRRFFLLVQLYESYSQIRTPDVYDKVERWRREVEALAEKMKEVRSRKTKEEANQLAEFICAQMMAIIKENLKLDPEKDESICEHWKKSQAGQ